MDSETFQSKMTESLKKILTPDRHALEYTYQWKEWDVPLGCPMPALRAMPIRDKKETGWRTPAACNGDGNPLSLERMHVDAVVTLQAQAALAGWPTVKANNHTGTRGEGGENLQTTAQLAGWSTLTATDGTRGNLHPRPHDTGIAMNQQAALTGWPTPSASGFEAVDTDRMEQPRAGCKERTGNGNGFGLTLGQATAALVPAGWGTPREMDWRDAGPAMETQADLVPANGYLARQVLGMTPSSSPAGMASRGALNPALSRWLQGYPEAWCLAAIRAHRSIRSTRTTPRKRGSCDSKATETRLTHALPQFSSGPSSNPKRNIAELDLACSSWWTAAWAYAQHDPDPDPDKVRDGICRSRLGMWEDLRRAERRLMPLLGGRRYVVGGRAYWIRSERVGRRGMMRMIIVSEEVDCARHPHIS